MEAGIVDDSGPRPPAEADFDLTGEGQVLGTPSFMAPEQAEAKLDAIGPATDVYGLGAMLYEILTGLARRSGEIPRSTCSARSSTSPSSAPRTLAAETPPALDAICMKAMAKRPEGRYESVADLARDLRCWLADEPTSVYREPRLRRAGRWVRRHRTLVASAAVVLVSAVIALSISNILIALERDAKANAFRMRTGSGVRRTPISATPEAPSIGI